MRKNTISFSYKPIKQAITAFRLLLNTHPELEEKKDLQPFSVLKM